MFLRYEHIDPISYPPGTIAAATVNVEPLQDGLCFYTRVPWIELGPGHPDRSAPFLMHFTFNRADNMLDVPTGDTPEEWSHNFSEIFIVKGPALSRIVSFVK